MTANVDDPLQNKTLRVFSVRVQNLLTAARDSGSDERDQISVRVQHSQVLQGTNGKWGFAVNAFRPFWKKTRNAPIELFVVALGQSRTMTMHSFRLQLDTRDSRDSNEIQPRQLPPGSAFLRMHLKETSLAVCTHYPLAISNSLSNSGLFFSLSPTFKCFAAFYEGVQPSAMHAKTSELLMKSLAHGNKNSVLVSMEPWSNAISVGSEGMVSILRLD